MTKSLARGRPRSLAISASLLLVFGSLLTGVGCGGGTLGDGTSYSHKALSSLVISPLNPIVAIGDNERFVVTGIYKDHSKQDVTSTVKWTVDDATVATIDTSGTATAKRSGVAQITATSGSLNASVKLTVADAALVSISITPTASSVPKGSTLQLSAIATLTDGSTRDVTAVATWASSSPDVAAVNSAGLVSGMATGAATITASSDVIRGAESVTVAPPPLVSLSISGTNSPIPKGRTQQFSVTGIFGDGSTSDVTGNVAWSVSPSSVVSISATGLATALTVGMAKITAISGLLSASMNFTVAPAALVSLSITPASPSVAKGGTQQLSVSGTLTDGSSQNMTGNVAWTVAPANVVSVSSQGLVTTIANGTATVTATSGSISGSDTITVTNASLVSITVTPASPSILSGKTQQFTATGTYGDGSTQDITNKVSWGGTLPGVADVSSAGLVTGRGAGTTTVTATSGSISGSDPVTVAAITLTSIAISPANATVPKGETQQLVATGTYNDGSTQDLTSKVTWTGGMAGVVDLTSAGMVTATKQGTANITAASGPVSGTTTVTASAAVPVSLAISPAAPTISVGSIQPFVAVEVFSDGTKKTVTKLAAWTSKNPDIASVDASGTAAGTAEGSATITAVYRSVTGSGSLIVVPVTYIVTEDRPRSGASSFTYFDEGNASGNDATLRISNAAGFADNACAMVYVFSADQQLSECCGCRVSKNGLRTLSFNTDLGSNPLTRQTLTSGTIEVDASDATNNPTCSPAVGVPSGSLTVWATHIQAVTLGEPAPSGNSSQGAQPNRQTQASVQTQCAYVQRLGSGQGICTCGTGD